MTGLRKQAKVLSELQFRTAMMAVSTRATAANDQAMILLSVKAGLRAKEIASITWAMVTNSDGTLADDIRLTNDASKGKRDGRIIPLHPDLRLALQRLHGDRTPDPNQRIIRDRRGNAMTANGVTVWFLRRYRSLGFVGASSHSGRRTFITRAARKIVEAGGSLRDVQGLAGHASLQTTARYIDQSADAKRRVVALV